MLKKMSVLSAALIIASLSASATSQDSPAFLGYNDLLNARDVFHAEIQSVESPNSPEDQHAAILSNLQVMLENPKVLGQLYAQYLTAFEKTGPVDEKSVKIFQRKLFQIAAHNLEARRGKHTWEMGVNQFTDMTREQYRAGYTGFNPKRLLAAFRNSTIPEVPAAHSPNAPPSVNWVTAKKVSSVKNQGNCNSCVMFASAAMMDSAHAIKNGGAPPELSPQELLDCAQPKRNICDDGSMDTPVLNYLQKQGLSTLASYPLAKDNKQKNCRSGSRVKAASVKSWSELEESEEALKSAVANGPCTVGIIGVEDFGKGIYDGQACTDDLTINHEVLVVGYGTEKGVDFWLIKNSYGQRWGDGGYFKLKRNANNVCKIGTDVMISVVAA